MTSIFGPIRDLQSLVEKTTLSRFPEVPRDKAHTSYLYWFGYWRMIRDTILGSPAIKSWATEYLKPRPGQDKEEYQTYLDSAVFFNAVDKTKNGLKAVVFSDEPKWKNYPEKFKSFFDEESRPVTKDRQTTLGLMKNVVTEVLTTGRVGILVDRTSYSEPGLPPPDPYIAVYCAEDIVNWVSEVDPKTGTQRLTQVLLTEKIMKPHESGIGMCEELQLRLLSLDPVYSQSGELIERVYTQRVYGKNILSKATLENFSESYVPTLKGETLDYIPFFFIGSVDNTENISKPPLLDIADLNVSHYQSYALLEQARRYTATPVYYVSGEGMGEDEELQVGASRLWKLGKDDKAGVIEFNGQGLKFLESALDKKEEQIQVLGGKLVGSVRKGPGTSSDLVSAQGSSENSILKTAVTNIEEAIANVFKEIFKWSFALPGTFEKFSVSLVSDSDSPVIGAREIRALQGLYDSGLMPKDKLFEILKDADYIPEDVTLEEFNRMIKDKNQIPAVVQPSDSAELMPGSANPSVVSDPAISPGKTLDARNFGDAGNKGINV